MNRYLMIMMIVIIAIIMIQRVEGTINFEEVSQLVNEKPNKIRAMRNKQQLRNQQQEEDDEPLVQIEGEYYDEEEEEESNELKKKKHNKKKKQKKRKTIKRKKQPKRNNKNKKKKEKQTLDKKLLETIKGNTRTQETTAEETAEAEAEAMENLLTGEGEAEAEAAAKEEGCTSEKSFVTTLLLSILLPGTGIDRMYIGLWGTGILKLVVNIITFGGLGIWNIIDIVLIATKKMYDYKGCIVRQ
mmetsp:Transcript_4594/g.6775  ORF Transcript_4594/g.6775 Transcript_4594/m.6775 type:complete len:243 (+) Transcript_4594:103-831(+)